MCCACDALKSTIITPVVIISNVIAFIFLVAVLATPSWYTISATVPPSVVIEDFQVPANGRNNTFVLGMGAIYSCFHSQGVGNVTNLNQLMSAVNNLTQLGCSVKLHNTTNLEACRNSTIPDKSQASCAATEIGFIIFYIACFFNLLTGALTFFMCCAKCVTCGCCGNSFSFLASIPAWLGFISLATCLLVTWGNMFNYGDYLLSYGSLSMADSVVIQVGVSFKLLAVATVSTLVVAVFLSIDARDSVLECCCKAGEYALWV